MLKSFLIPVLVFANVLLGGCKTIGTTSPPGPASVVENSPLPAPTQQTGSTSAPLTETPGRQQDIWEAVRAALPPQVPVYIPAWLPPEFGQDVALQYAYDEGGDAGPTYLVTYRSDEGDSLHFAMGPVRGTSPNTVEPITVHGMKGVLFTTPGNPKIGVTWKDGQRVYHVQAFGDEISRAQLLRIVDSLTPVEQNLATPPPPGPPPTSKWDLPVTGLYLLEHPEVMQASDKGIVLTIHYIIVEGQEVTVFFSAGAAAELSPVVPETAWLRGVAEGGAGQSMSDNAVVPLERSVTTVEQFDNVTLGVLAFKIRENNLPLLSLEVPRMAVRGGGPERRYVDGAWTIPLLKDQEPGRPRPYASQLFTTAPLGVEYDEVSVIQGDNQETNFAIGGRPEVTGGVDLFFVFTLSSPNEQRSVYLLLLTDGSIEKVTQAEYLARLRMLDVPPTPFPTPVSEGPDALETFAPPPTEPTPQVSLEEILKSFGTMTPPARRIRTLTPSPFVPPAGTPPSMPPTSTPLSSPGN